MENLASSENLHYLSTKGSFVNLLKSPIEPVSYRPKLNDSRDIDRSVMD